jgi:hypothetical protein
VAEEISQESGRVEIEDADTLMRWVHKFNTDRRADGSVKKLRPGAFPLAPQDKKGFSLYLEKLMSFETCKAKAIAENPLHIGIVRLTARDFRDFDLDVEQSPEDDELAHCQVTKYESKSDADLTNIARAWIQRTQNTYTPISP